MKKEDNPKAWESGASQKKEKRKKREKYSTNERTRKKVTRTNNKDEISNLPEREFRMTVKILQSL